MPKKGNASKKKPAKIRITLKAFDHTIIDEATKTIIETAQRTGAIVFGPIPLPTKIKKYTVNRATFIFKKAKEQFEKRIYKRIIDITESTSKTIESLSSLSLPSGVSIEIKMLS